MDLASARRVAVVDLGFGDAGKGTVTDFLVRRMEARAVVRFNGGAQAGHNVVTPNGRHHTFAQWGSGTFVPGVHTFLSKHVVFHPTALLVERDHLERAGVMDPLARLTVSEECLVTTPVHQAATCVRELARGASRHGSCGVGHGETVKDALLRPDEAIRARDLHDPRQLLSRVLRLQEKKRSELAEALGCCPDDELGRVQRAALSDPDVIRRWVEKLAWIVRAGVIRGDEALGAVLAGDAPVVFEGAQGVLLDEWLGFHPHTTWSTCTWENATALSREHGGTIEPYRLGVLRTYLTRHGAGPFPTESPEVPSSRTAEHNVVGPWQGRFRLGWFDAVLARYALEGGGGADGLALTHLDRIHEGAAWPMARAHQLELPASLVSKDDSGHVTRLRLPPPRDLSHVEALGRGLEGARPVYDRVHGGKDSVVKAVEECLGVAVALASTGPTATEKVLRR